MQTIDGCIDGLLALVQSVYSTTLDTTYNEQTATFNGLQLVVVEGLPGAYQPDLIIAVATDVRQPIDRPTLGTNRSREITAEIDIVVSAAIAGDATAQLAARKAANAAAEPIQAYFRTQGQETLGGSCREAWVSNIQGPKAAPVFASDGSPWGRSSDLTITVTAHIRN